MCFFTYCFQISRLKMLVLIVLCTKPWVVLSFFAMIDFAQQIKQQKGSHYVFVRIEFCIVQHM